jgi:uncharacterized protein YndB with AHSA1/START domain
MIVSEDESLLEITRILDAAPARVFHAWLSRDEWQAWLGPEGVSCDVGLLEPHVGGRYRVTMNLPDGSVVSVAGVFKMIEEPRRLIFTWGWEGDDTRQSVITLTFKDLGSGRTELTLRQEGLGTVENRDGHAKAWNSALSKLADYLATSSRNTAA